MLKLSWCAASAAIALAGCASSGTPHNTLGDASAAPTAMASAQPATAAPPPASAQTTPSTPAGSGTYTDAQLRSFAAASHAIEPLTPQLQSTTPAVKAAAVEQVRTILARNNLDAPTYNAIAAQAQADPALAQRIAALSSPASSPG